MAKIKVKWEVEDGYVGKSRPQVTTIDTDDYDWDNMTIEEKHDAIQEAVQDDFDSKVTFNISDYGI